MTLSKNKINHDESYLENYYSSVSLKHRQKYGQFFTPYSVAKFMAKWIDLNNCQTILDPAFGLGIFARAILDQSHIKIVGFEIDELIYSRAIEMFRDDPVVINNQDYIDHDWNNKYDAIICNPPYLKFHNYDNKGKLEIIKKRLKINLDSCSNLYTLFLLKAIDQLKNGGKAAFLIPSEFMNADYGNLIKNWLIENNLLEYIIILDFRENFFDDALTTSCILLLSKNINNKYIKFLTINNSQQLERISEQINQQSIDLSTSKIYQSSEINPLIKWRIYYQGQNSLKYKNLVPFSTYAQVVRGIATGDNDYFTFSKSKQLEYQIESDYLLPCITKAHYIKLPFFDHQSLQQLINKDQKIFLLNVHKLDDKYIKKYLLIGEKKEVHKKYLTSHRKPWYKIENRPPAPILVNVFNRNGLRFVRNEANVYNLTTFHCVYPNLLILNKLDLFFAYLITPVAKEIFNDNRREYAQGLRKFEPNDLNNSSVINLDIIDQNMQEYLIDVFHLYRQSILTNDILKSDNYLDCLNHYFIKILQK